MSLEIPAAALILGILTVLAVAGLMYLWGHHLHDSYSWEVRALGWVVDAAATVALLVLGLAVLLWANGLMAVGYRP